MPKKPKKWEKHLINKGCVAHIAITLDAEQIVDDTFWSDLREALLESMLDLKAEISDKPTYRCFKCERDITKETKEVRS